MQAALRQRIGVLGDDLLVVAEEYGEFLEANRRIDLLCVDRSARLVVVELKRTTDGGHMELQALRYAAMVSTMTFNDVVAVYERHLGDTDEDARAALVEWFTEVDDEEPVIQRDVRIILVAAGFDKQITTTALWLADVYNLDLRCVKVTPYKVDGRLLLDVQQIIPLAEAEDFLIQVRRRETVVRATAVSGRDWTPYVVTTPAGSTAPLRKRRAILAVVQALGQVGVPAATIKSVLGRRFLVVDGVLAGDELVTAFVARYPAAQRNVGRWFVDEPIHDAGQTWLLSKMWGADTEPALAGLVALAPDAQVSFAPA